MIAVGGEAFTAGAAFGPATGGSSLAAGTVAAIAFGTIGATEVALGVAITAGAGASVGAK
jgi:hypothetical protein